MREINITFLNAADVDKLQLSDEEILGAVEAGLKAQGEGDTVIEPRVHLVPERPDKGVFNILRGYVKPLNLACVKVVGDYVDNYQHDLPSGIATLNLFDPETGAPKAILYATSMTDMRTGAMTAIGAKYLARKNSRVLGHIGARGTAYWNIRFLNSLFDFEEIRIHSRRAESRDALGARLERDLGRKITVVNNWQDCLDGADIMVEASRLPAPKPMLMTSWVKKGALVVPYGSQSAVEITLTDVMDKVVVDDWGQCQPGMKFGALRQHVESGKLTQNNLHAEMGEIVAGKRLGRERDDETILFWHRGLSLSDIALGHAMLAKAKHLGIGQTLKFA
jgi:alanine dehydrogenase